MMVIIIASPALCHITIIHHYRDATPFGFVDESKDSLYVCMYVCMYVFIKLHITTQSGPVILVILCHSH